MTRSVSVPFYVALLHAPIRNRKGEEVVTSVTNLDLHDISRTARTYGAKKFFVVTPLEDQRELVGRILKHWKSDQAKAWHPDRVEALSLITLKGDFEDVLVELRSLHGESPEVVLTDASPFSRSVSYAELRRDLEDSLRTRPLVLVFGTGWGISETFYPVVDRILAPIYGPEGNGGYNHLSVRAAVAAICDRLFGR